MRITRHANVEQDFHHISELTFLDGIDQLSSMNIYFSDIEYRYLEDVLKRFPQDSTESLYQQILMNSDKVFSDEEQALATNICEFRNAVFKKSREILDTVDPPEKIKALFLRAIEETEGEIFVYPCFPPIDLPFALVDTEYVDTPEQLVPLSVVSLYYYLGIALYDDLIDNDLSESWKAVSKQNIGLTSIALFAGLPARILEHYYGTSPQAYTRLSHIILETLYSQAIGQFMDMDVDLGHPELLHISEKVTSLKVGTTGALTGQLVSAFLRLPDEVAENFTRFCKNLYISMQLTSDIFDIWSKPISPDLANGTVTLPISYAYLSLPEDGRADFKKKIESNLTTVAEHDELRRIIETTNAFLFSLTKSELFRKKAVENVRRLGDAGVPTDCFYYFAKAACVCST